MNPANINTIDYWNSVYRAEWESGMVQSTQYNRDYGPIHDAIVRLIPDGGEVLDIACGTGLLCRKIKQARPATRVLGVDFSDYTVARNSARDAALGVEYRCLDIASALPSLARTFDVVMMCEILEHLDQPEAVVAQALNLLRKGGLFILTCPHNDGIPSPEHVRIWGHDELFHLLARYSTTVCFQHFPPPYFHIWMMAFLHKDSMEEFGGAQT